MRVPHNIIYLIRFRVPVNIFASRSSILIHCGEACDDNYVLVSGAQWTRVGDQ